MPTLNCLSMEWGSSLTRWNSPVYGVIFLFKYPTGETRHETPIDGTFDYEAAENQFFAAQTIQNACGTQALLSVLLNKGDSVDIGPKLQEFKDFTGAFPADVSPTKRETTLFRWDELRVFSYEEKRFRIRS